MSDPSSFDGSVVGLKLGDRLGKGNHSTVYKCYFADAGQKTEFALKIVARSALTEKELTQFGVAKQKMKKLKNPNICQLKEIYEQKDSIGLLYEYCNSSSVAKYVEDSGENVDIASIKRIISEVCKAAIYLQGKGLVHLKLLPEKIVFNWVKRPYVEVRVTDCGSYLWENNVLSYIQRQRWYIEEATAQEKPQFNKMDSYAIGILVLLLVSPQIELPVANLEDGLIVESPKQLSIELIDLLNACLQYSYADRIGLKEIEAHPFIMSNRDTFDASFKCEYDGTTYKYTIPLTKRLNLIKSYAPISPAVSMVHVPEPAPVPVPMPVVAPKPQLNPPIVFYDKPKDLRFDENLEPISIISPLDDKKPAKNKQSAVVPQSVVAESSEPMGVPQKPKAQSEVRGPPKSDGRKLYIELKKWLTRAGGSAELTDVIEGEGGVRKVIARRNIVKGSRILCVPNSCLVSLETAQSSVTIQSLIKAKCKINHPTNVQFSVWCLEEKVKDKSRYQDYIKTFPENVSNYPLLYSKEELEGDLSGSLVPGIIKI